MARTEIRCPNCSHLLFKATGDKGVLALMSVEIKCPKCKALVEWPVHVPAVKEKEPIGVGPSERY